MAYRPLTPEEAQALSSVGCIIKCQYKDNNFLSIVPENWVPVLSSLKKFGWSYFIEVEE